MTRKLVALAAGAAVSAFLAAGAAQAQLSPANFTYYAGYNEVNPGFDFTGATIFGTDNGVVGIAENRDLGGSDTAPNWPLASVVFMADVTATFNAPVAGDYALNLGSDDGSYAYIDGNLALNDGGAHGITYVSGVDFLTAGSHSVEIQYGNEFCCGAVLDFTISAVPEPATWAIMLVGFGGLGASMRARRRLARA